MDYMVMGVVFLTSITSLPVALLINQVDFLKDFRIMYVAGGLCVAAAAVTSVFVLRRRYRNVDFVIYVFAIFCWPSFFDLFLGLELDGYVSFFLSSSILKETPFLNSSHGTMFSYWDGTVQYLLQFSGVTVYCMQKSYREVGLYWSGAIINGLLVILAGAFVGNTAIKWLFYMEMSFIVLPLTVAFKLIRDRPLQAHSYSRVSPITKRPVDMMFLIYFIFALCITIFRGMAVLGGTVPLIKTYLTEYEPYLSDPSSFPKVQMLIYLFYFSMYYLCVIDGLLNPRQIWMTDWAIIHAGASAQSQFVHMTSAIHSRTVSMFHAPQSGMACAVFWGINLALLIVPHLFAWRCWKDPDNCGRTYTTDIARPINQRPIRQSFRFPKKGE